MLNPSPNQCIRCGELMDDDDAETCDWCLEDEENEREDEDE